MTCGVQMFLLPWREKVMMRGRGHAGERNGAMTPGRKHVGATGWSPDSAPPPFALGGAGSHPHPSRERGLASGLRRRDDEVSGISHRNDLIPDKMDVY